MHFFVATLSLLAAATAAAAVNITVTPSATPTSANPSAAPTFAIPSATPSASPTTAPTTSKPSKRPTSSKPSKRPATAYPTSTPTTSYPTHVPTQFPSRFPSRAPLNRPSRAPLQSPSASPVSTKPSRTPVRRPSYAPLHRPRCANDSLDRLPSGMHRFAPIELQRSTCEVFDVVGRNFLTKKNFDCEVDACVRWCNYDSMCKFVLWSGSERTCVKAVSGHVTDDSDRSERFYAEGWRAFILRFEFGGPVAPPYYTGPCALRLQAACDGDPRCGWKRGKRGYNVERLGGMTNGWCGRVAC